METHAKVVAANEALDQNDLNEAARLRVPAAIRKPGYSEKPGFSSPPMENEKLISSELPVPNCDEV